MRLTEAALRRAWSSGDWEGLLRRTFGSPNTILDLARSGSVREALRVFRSSCRSRETPPPTEFFREFVHVLVEGNRVKEAEQVYSSMRWFRVSTDLKTEATLLTSYVRGGQGQKVVSFMRSLQFQNRHGVAQELVKNFLNEREFALLYRFVSLAREMWMGIYFSAAVNESVRTGTPEQAELVLRGMLKNLDSKRKQLGVYGYASLLKCFRGHDYTKALKTFKGMREVGVEPNAHCVCALLDTFVLAKQYRVAVQVFNEIRDEGSIPLDAAVYNVLLEALTELEDVDGLDRTLSEMTERDLASTPRTVMAQIRCYSSQGLLQRAEDAYEEARRAGLADLIVYNRMLDVYGKRGELGRVMELFCDMQARRIRPDVFTYCSLMFAHGRNLNVEEAVSVFEGMRAMGVKPNLVAYTTLASLFVKVGNSNAAIKIIDEAIQNGIQPDFAMAKVVTKAYALKGGIGAAVESVRKTLGGNIDDEVVRTLLLTYAESGEMKGAADMLAANWDRKGLACASTCNRMMRCAATLEDALYVLRKVRPLGFTADIGTAAAVADVALKAGNVGVAWHIVEEISKMDEGKEKRRGLLAALASFSEAGMGAGVLWILEHVGKDEDVPLEQHKLIAQCLKRERDANTLKRLLCAYGGGKEKLFVELAYTSAIAEAHSYAGDRESTTQAIERLKTLGKQLTVADMNSLIRCHALAPQYALEEMRQAGVTPDVETFHLLLSRSQDTDELTRAVAEGFPLQLEAYEALIESYRNLGNLEAAVRTVKIMERRHVQADLRSLNALLELHVLLGSAQGVADALRRIFACQQRPNDQTFVTLVTAVDKHGPWNLAKEIVTVQDGSGAQFVQGALTALIDALASAGRADSAHETVSRLEQEGVSVHLSPLARSSLCQRSTQNLPE